jgi:SAM-dependent methyltransferase
MIFFPPEFDAKFYRDEYSDLRNLTDEQLEAHYRQHGANEGRSPNRFRTRDDFVTAIPPSASVLEIGPYFSPVARGNNVKYFDVLSQEGLLERSRHQGHTDAKPPFINYVSPNGDLSIVDCQFDFVVSSHCLEHQPDLVKHLRGVSQILNPGGCYLALVPDKRFCFDHFIAESTIAGVLDAHCTNRATHSLRSIIEHIALTTHNDPIRHWSGDHGKQFDDLETRIKESVGVYENARGGYVDVHAWYLTPDFARHLFPTLHRMDYIDLECTRCYGTRKNSSEFWIVLEKTLSRGSSVGPRRSVKEVCGQLT